LAARACAPTMRYRTRFAFNKPINSFQSGGSVAINSGGALPQCLDGGDTFGGAHALPIANLVGNRGARVGPAEYLLHEASIAGLRRSGNHRRHRPPAQGSPSRIATTRGGLAAAPTAIPATRSTPHGSLEWFVAMGPPAAVSPCEVARYRSTPHASPGRVVAIASLAEVSPCDMARHRSTPAVSPIRLVANASTAAVSLCKVARHRSTPPVSPSTLPHIENGLT
jgi:hypothetical protein